MVQVGLSHDGEVAEACAAAADEEDHAGAAVRMVFARLVVEGVERTEEGLRYGVSTVLLVLEEGVEVAVDDAVSAHGDVVGVVGEDQCAEFAEVVAIGAGAESRAAFDVKLDMRA